MRCRSSPESHGCLRYFDRISFYPVSADELMDLRADMAAGRGEVDISDSVFSMRHHTEFLAQNAESISAWRERQRAAFAAERQAWNRGGEVVTQIAS